MNLNPLIGIGLRSPHYQKIIEESPPIGWFEVHSENFFAKGGNTINLLCAISVQYPISLHGVGLSLGSADGVSNKHLKRLLSLINKIEPKLVSEHLSWGYINGTYLPDLLPIPYNQESFEIFKTNLLKTQDFLKRELLIENPSSYFEYKDSNQSEIEFLVNLCCSSGAKILLDINNIFVSSWNHGWDAKKYIDFIPAHLVKEIHIAGHSIQTLPNNQILRIDTHDNYICNEVWALYDYAIKKFGPIPTLLEWDSHIPPLEVLIKEASKANHFLSQYENKHAIIS